MKFEYLTSTMKSSVILVVSTFILILFSCGSDDISRQVEVIKPITLEQQEIIDAINAEAIALHPEPLLTTDSELSFLDEIGDAKLIGLGEATHGTKEFFQMKHRIFQYLVEQHGFKAFLFEMDLAEALLFNDWVQHRMEGDLEQMMIEHMLFWTWRTVEVKDLLTWIREYNGGKEEVEMISFYGVDNQSDFYNRNALIELVEEVDKELAAQLKSRTVDYSNLRTIYSDRFTEEIAVKIKNDIQFVIEEINKLTPKIEEILGFKKALIAQRLSRHMEQVELVQYDRRVNNEEYKRDLYMAENTSWYFDLLGQNSKFVLWAHNYHLGDYPNYAGQSGGSQGHYLKEQYSTDYQVLGFSFATGRFTAVGSNGFLKAWEISKEAVSESINWYFSKADHHTFVIKTNPSNVKLKNWFERTRKLMMLGSSYNGTPEVYYGEHLVQQHYDYLIHVNETQNSDLL